MTGWKRRRSVRSESQRPSFDTPADGGSDAASQALGEQLQRQVAQPRIAYLQAKGVGEDEKVVKRARRERPQPDLVEVLQAAYGLVAGKFDPPSPGEDRGEADAPVPGEVAVASVLEAHQQGIQCP